MIKGQRPMEKNILNKAIVCNDHFMVYTVIEKIAYLAVVRQTVILASKVITTQYGCLLSAIPGTIMES